ncbi:hypothetical protein EYC80_006347 [Monilinia laxa]|uniref:Uncharacterized protein n=1 Tax=Monilinia laxa TaxID=61186 RepID=A0A5N6JTJ1_MONLA|nr:hypothetical protein EYC80_006347 [Monilinia laxa]
MTSSYTPSQIDLYESYIQLPPKYQRKNHPPNPRLPHRPPHPPNLPHPLRKPPTPLLPHPHRLPRPPNPLHENRGQRPRPRRLLSGGKHLFQSRVAGARLPGLCSGCADPHAFGGGWRATGGLYWVVPHGQHRDASPGAKIHGRRRVRRGRGHAPARARPGGRGPEPRTPAGAVGAGGDPAAGGPLPAAVGVPVSEWGRGPVERVLCVWGGGVFARGLGCAEFGCEWEGGRGEFSDGECVGGGVF